MGMYQGSVLSPSLFSVVVMTRNIVKRSIFPLGRVTPNVFSGCSVPTLHSKFFHHIS